MNKKVNIIGMASKKETSLFLQEADLKTDLMSYLRDKGYPIASSCFGEGICNKCELIINGKHKKSCQTQLRTIIVMKNITIQIEYL